MMIIILFVKVAYLEKNQLRRMGFLEGIVFLENNMKMKMIRKYKVISKARILMARVEEEVCLEIKQLIMMIHVN